MVLVGPARVYAERGNIVSMATSDLDFNDRLEPKACGGCGAVVDTEDERCRACGMQQPEKGWVTLPEDGPPPDDWDDEAETRIAAIPDPVPTSAAPATIVIPPAPMAPDGALTAFSEDDLERLDGDDLTPIDEEDEDDDDSYEYVDDEDSGDYESVDDPQTNTARPIRVRIAPQMLQSGDEEEEEENDSVAAYSEELLEATADKPLNLERGVIYAGRYRVTEKIGLHGNVARFLAIQEPMVRRVVLRVLQPTDMPRDRREFIAQRFLRDTKRLAQMAHPNLARVYDFGRGPEGTAFCTTEVMHGLTLREVLNVGPLPMSRLLFVLHHATAGLAAMHENDMVHRNLRAANVVLDMDQRGRDLIRLGGYGFGVLLSDVEDATGELFLAPELREGNEPTPASDVYALGVLFHKALTGRAPGEERDDGATDQMELPHKLVALVAAMIADDPKDRFSDAGAVLEELGPAPKGFEPNLGEEDAPAAKRAPAPPPTPPTPWLAIAATALFTAGASAGGYWYFDSRTPPEVVITEVPAEAATIDESAITERVDAAVADALEDFKEEQRLLDEEREAERLAKEEARKAEQAAAAAAAEAARVAAARPKPRPPVVEEPEPEPEPEPIVVEPVVVEVEPEPVVEEPPPPPPKYPKALSLSGLWVGKADGGQFALTLSVDGDGKVTGSSARTDGGETISGRVTGQVVPKGKGWSVELTAVSSAGAITYSGQLTGTEMKGRMYAGGRSVGRWNAHH